MVKSGAQAVKLPISNFQKKSELEFSSLVKTAESSVVEKLSEKLEVELRFSRLKKRMKRRSSNIL